MKQYIRNILRQYSSDDKKSWEEIPMTLRRHLIFYIIVDLGVGILAIINRNFFGLGLIVFMGFFIYSVYLYLNFSYKKYFIVEGKCVEVVTHTLLHSRDVYLENKNGEVYMFTSYIKKKRVIGKKSNICKNDNLRVYVFDKNSVIEAEGFYRINKYYTANKFYGQI